MALQEPALEVPYFALRWAPASWGWVGMQVAMMLFKSARLRVCECVSGGGVQIRDGASGLCRTQPHPSCRCPALHAAKRQRALTGPPLGPLLCFRRISWPVRRPALPPHHTHSHACPAPSRPHVKRTDTGPDGAPYRLIQYPQPPRPHPLSSPQLVHDLVCPRCAQPAPDCPPVRPLPGLPPAHAALYCGSGNQGAGQPPCEARGGWGWWG